MSSQRCHFCVAAISAMLCVGVSCHAEQVLAPSTKQAEALASWRSLKYGMFIHYGMSTFTGVEHDPGNKPSATYAPTNLNVDQWIRVARDADMKYAVLTSKHVAGHCLCGSKVQRKGKEFAPLGSNNFRPPAPPSQSANPCQSMKIGGNRAGKPATARYQSHRRLSPEVDWRKKLSGDRGRTTDHSYLDTLSLINYSALGRHAHVTKPRADGQSVNQ